MIKQDQLIYLEQKSGFSDNGPAWITRARISRSGRTIYFEGRALKHQGGANYLCLETRDRFWISGVKVAGGDRHWAGHGAVRVDHRVVRDYLALRGLSALDPLTHVVVSDLKETDVSKFHDLENEARKRHAPAFPEGDDS